MDVPGGVTLSQAIVVGESEPPTARGHARRLRQKTWSAVAVSSIGLLVAYVVLAAGWRPEGVANEPPGEIPAIPTAAVPAVSSVAPPRLPDLARRPTLGICASTTDDLAGFIAATGTHPEVFDTYESWSLERPLQPAFREAVAMRGIRLSITWEPWDSTGPTTEQPHYSLRSVIQGAHDSYIDLYARSIKEYPHQVTIRLMHEMNGDWYPWSSGVNGNQSGEFILAWRHIHDRFRALGVTNVTWMWAPNAIYPGSAPLASLYPGDAYVDAVGVSNYNWGDNVRDGFTTRWRSFDSLFEPTISELRTLTEKPLWIAEVASSNNGGSKAAWLSAMFVELQARPEITGALWFSEVDRTRGVDWRIETEPEAVKAWREGFFARFTIERIGR